MRNHLPGLPATTTCLTAMALAAALDVCADPWLRQRGSLIASVHDLDIASPEVVYAAGERGLILRTRDGGVNWEFLPSIVDLSPLDFHAVDFCDADRGLVASSSHLLVTEDGGGHWRQAVFPQATYIGSIAFPARDAAYFEGSTGYSGIWKSIDGGASWIRIIGNTRNDQGALTNLHFVSADTGFALRKPAVRGADWQVMATRDGGETWTETRIGLPRATLYHDSLVALRFADARTGYALGFYVGPTPAVRYCLKTVDGGATWDSIPAPPSTHWRDLRFVHPDTGWSLGTDGLAGTVDGGATWTLRSFVNVRAMGAFRMGGINASGFRAGFAGGASGQILRTGETAAWKECFTIVSPIDLLGVHFPRRDTGFAAGSAGLALRTRDGGRNWESMNPEPGRYRDYTGVHFVTPLTGFLVGGDSGSVLRTEDGGSTWNRPAMDNAERLNAVWFATETVGMAVGLAGKVLRSVDGGRSWSPSPSGTTRALRAVHFPTPQIGFAAGDSGTLLKTMDAGATWTPLAAGTHANLRSVRFLDGLTGFVAGDGALLLKTGDGGTSWSPRSISAAGPGAIHALAFSDANRGLAAGSGHLWETSDAGESWSRTVLPGEPVLRGAAYGGNTAYVVGESGRILASGGYAADILPVRAPGVRRKTPGRIRVSPWIMLGPDGIPRDMAGRRTDSIDR